MAKIKTEVLTKTPDETQYALESQLPSGVSGDAIRRIGDNWLVTRDTPIYVSDMDGADFTTKFENALERQKSQATDGHIILPGGWHQLVRTIVLQESGSPQLARLLTGIKISGGPSTVIWSHPNLQNSPMLEVLAADRLTIENVKFEGRNLQDFVAVAGCMGLYIRAGWEHSGNTATSMLFDRLSFANLGYGVYLGSPLGPDLRGITFPRCSFFQCVEPVTVNGANITSVTFPNCTFAGANALFGWRFIYNGSLEFAANEVMDPWGVAWAWDKYTTTQWLARIIDASSRNGNHVDFVSSEARTIGGGPYCQIRDCDIALTSATSRPAILSEGCQFSVDDLRVEGNQATALDMRNAGDTTTIIPNRFAASLNKVTMSGAQDPAVVVATNAGPPLIISDSYFSGSIPDAATDRVIYRGLIRTPAGTLGV